MSRFVFPSLVGAVLCLVLGSAAASASPVALGMSGGDAWIVVDGATGHVLVDHSCLGAPPAGGKLSAFDLNGSPVASTTPFMTSPTFDPSTGLLYGAAPGAASYLTLDPSTLATDAYSPALGTPDQTFDGCSGGLADGMFWAAGADGFSSITLDSSHTKTDYSFPGGQSSGLALAANPATNQLVVASLARTTTPTITSYDVSSGVPVEEATWSEPTTGTASSNIHEIAISPDGEHVFVLPYPYKPVELSLPSLTPETTFNVPPMGQWSQWAGEMGISGDGKWLALGTGATARGPVRPEPAGIDVYRTTSPTPVRTYAVPNRSEFVGGGRFAFAPDLTKLYVSWLDGKENAHFDVLTDPTRAATSLTLTASKTSITDGQAVRLSVHLTDAPGGTVRIYHTRGTSPVLVGNLNTGAAGNATLTLHPGQTRYYYATYAGSSSTLSSRSKTITVRVS
jgi:hypothetical protein